MLFCSLSYGTVQLGPAGACDNAEQDHSEWCCSPTKMQQNMQFIFQLLLPLEVAKMNVCLPIATWTRIIVSRPCKKSER